MSLVGLTIVPGLTQVIGAILRRISLLRGRWRNFWRVHSSKIHQLNYETLGNPAESGTWNCWVVWCFRSVRARKSLVSFNLVQSAGWLGSSGTEKMPHDDTFPCQISKSDRFEEWNTMKTIFESWFVDANAIKTLNQSFLFLFLFSNHSVNLVQTNFKHNAYKQFQICFKQVFAFWRPWLSLFVLNLCYCAMLLSLVVNSGMFGIKIFCLLLGHFQKQHFWG